MSFYYRFFVLSLFMGAAVSLVAAALVWRRRAAPGGWALAAALLALAQWSLSAAFEAAASDAAVKIAWSQAEYLGQSCVAPLFMIFALQYCRLDHWLTPRTLVALWAVPATNFLMALTNAWHGWLWPSFTLEVAEGASVLIYGHGPWFWIGVPYSFVIATLASAVLLRSSSRVARVYRVQTIALVAAPIAPMLTSLFYVVGLVPVRGMDVGPLGFTLTGLLIVGSVFRFHLFDLVPVARSTVLESMGDGVVVLDGRDRIVEHNPAAARLFRQQVRTIGRPVAETLLLWPEIVAAGSAVGEDVVEIERPDGLGCWDVRVTPLRDRTGMMRGRLVVLRDITKRRLADEQLRQANERLQGQLAAIQSLQASLHEQATRDTLTGLFNRGYLDCTLVRELARAQREERPLSLVILDVDHFKDVNDGHGHRAGDTALQALGSLLRRQTRQGDIACRFGGDELAVVLPGAGQEDTARRAEEWRAAFAAEGIVWDGTTFRATFSAGLATYPGDGATVDDLLRAADRALYAAKAAGRNRVVVAGG